MRPQTDTTFAEELHALELEVLTRRSKSISGGREPKHTLKQEQSATAELFVGNQAGDQLQEELEALSTRWCLLSEAPHAAMQSSMGQHSSHFGAVRPTIPTYGAHGVQRPFQATGLPIAAPTYSHPPLTLATVHHIPSMYDILAMQLQTAQRHREVLRQARSRAIEKQVLDRDVRRAGAVDSARHGVSAIDKHVIEGFLDRLETLLRPKVSDRESASSSSTPPQLRRGSEAHSGDDMADSRERVRTQAAKAPLQKKKVKVNLAPIETGAKAKASATVIASEKLIDDGLMEELQSLIKDDDDTDGASPPMPVEPAMSPARGLKSPMNRTTRAYRKGLGLWGLAYHDVPKPRWRYVHLGEPVPTDPSQLLKGKHIFRGVGIGLVFVFARMRAWKARRAATQQREAAEVEMSMPLYFEQCKAWVTKVTRPVLTSIVQDDKTRLDLQGSRSLLSVLRGGTNVLDEVVKSKLIRLMVRVKGIITGICSEIPPSTILSILCHICCDGCYFPKGFLFDCERDRLDFSELGATRHMFETTSDDTDSQSDDNQGCAVPGLDTVDVSRVAMMATNFLLVRVLVDQVLLNHDAASPTVAHNFRVLASVVYMVVRLLRPELHDLREKPTGKSSGVRALIAKLDIHKSSSAAPISSSTAAVEASDHASGRHATAPAPTTSTTAGATPSGTAKTLDQRLAVTTITASTDSAANSSSAPQRSLTDSRRITDAQIVDDLVTKEYLGQAAQELHESLGRLQAMLEDWLGRLVQEIAKRSSKKEIRKPPPVITVLPPQRL